ncbi:MAG: hypothetical protein KC433_07940 [Anaerolineales bacterium]|nr:hypothetical protein [Anaerolineales bacterium]MCB8936969.1 hypothetical protein [Ardenticatenaceae bacterium]
MSDQKKALAVHDELVAISCPPREWERDNVCDISILTYRFTLRIGDIPVECVSRYRVERCTEDYVLSDLLHSTTLFPGEEVFMSVRNRHTVSRFTEDKSYSASQISRSSDRIWMETYKDLATDFDQSTSSKLTTSTHSDFSQGGVSGGGGINIGIAKIGASGSYTKGSFDANSSQEFVSELHNHLRSSFHQTNQVARDSSSVSLTEVNSHREVTSEQNDELKVSTRRFKNINRCHTMTHYFYQIAKRQRVTIELIERTCRAVNDQANTAVEMKPMSLSLAANQFIPSEPKVGTSDGPGFVALAATQPGLALSRDQLTLQSVGRISAAIFDQAAKARAAAVAKADAIVAKLPGFEPFEQVSIIPTEALYVESELGDCALCEPFVIAQHELELERMKLENVKLRREIELMEHYKDYRCCDDDHEDDDSDD